MFGHSPPAVVRALAAQTGHGLTYMLPTEHALAVGALLRDRFGLPHWQIATTASDANRFALRVARAVTGRPRIVIMNGCYHGAVDETYVDLDHGRARNQPGLIGQFADLTEGTRVVEFNDVAALERALAPGDVACVITEPVLTNCCMVLPEPGYHDALRRVTRASGTLLLIDETHTISTGPAATRAPTGSSRTCSSSASRSPAACRRAPGASARRSAPAGTRSAAPRPPATLGSARRCRRTRSRWRRCARRSPR